MYNMYHGKSVKFSNTVENLSDQTFIACTYIHMVYTNTHTHVHMNTDMFASQLRHCVAAMS